MDGINFTKIWESEDLSVTSRVKVFERDKEIVIYDASKQSVIVYEIPVTDSDPAKLKVESTTSGQVHIITVINDVLLT